MKPLPVFLTGWAATGIGAVVGSILGNAGGRPGLFAGAVVGGVVGVGAAVAAVIKLRWLPSEDRVGAFIGGIVGFAVAASSAVSHLHTHVTPVLICSFAGVGVVLGSGVARGWRRSP